MQPKKYSTHLSFSQVKSIDTCGEQFRLERGYGLRGLSRWATVGGKAFHTATEYIDFALAFKGSDVEDPEVLGSAISKHTAGQDEAGPEAVPAPEPEIVKVIRRLIEGYKADKAAREVAMAELAEGIRFEVPGEDDEPSDPVKALWNEALNWSIDEELVNLNTGDLKQYEREGILPDENRPEPTEWLASGRASKAWPDKEDRTWWDHHGPIMLKNFLIWRQTSGWHTAWWDGVPAIELDVSCDLEGIPTKAFLDRVEMHPDFGVPMPVVVDLKTNKVEPADAEQLGWYATALEILGRPRPEWGAYYVARTGKIGQLHPLGQYTIEFFAWKYQLSLAKRDNDGLVAQTSSPFCKSCGVRSYCYAVSGELSHTIPKPWEEAAAKRKSLPLHVVDPHVDL